MIELLGKHFLEVIWLGQKMTFKFFDTVPRLLSGNLYQFIVQPKVPVRCKALF